jgi:alpha-beta hydrolase superfamily lysophospholipase
MCEYLTDLSQQIFQNGHYFTSITETTFKHHHPTTRNTIMNIPLIFLLLFMLTACAPKIYQPGPEITAPHLTPNQYITADGVHLPYKQWLPKHGNPTAVIIAVHGFNDYSHFFAQPAEFFSQQGMACYAYDQRHFGGSPQRGLWSGAAAYVQDLGLFVRLIKQRHPDAPVYVLGESMGGAIVINAMAASSINQATGFIWVAPAVWARATMPWYQPLLLWGLAHTVPWLTLTGKGIKVRPSDNIQMLQALAKDPLFIKASRVETLYGLVDLMDAASLKAQTLEGSTLLLYGDKDDIIPKKPTYAFARQWLTNRPQHKTVAFYENGHHMLLRDLDAQLPWRDILAWIKSPAAPLPSGADQHARKVLHDDGRAD